MKNFPVSSYIHLFVFCDFSENRQLPKPCENIDENSNFVNKIEKSTKQTIIWKK